MREPLELEDVCACDEGEVCRVCVGSAFHERLLVKVGEPWRREPEAVKERVAPLEWLALTADRN